MTLIIKIVYSMNPIVYKNIKKIRELKNLTREYVADELQMSTSGYGKIERGEVDLTVSATVTDVVDGKVSLSLSATSAGVKVLGMAKAVIQL